MIDGETWNGYVNILNQLAKRKGRTSPAGTIFWEDMNKSPMVWKCFLCGKEGLDSAATVEHGLAHLKEYGLLVFI